MDSTRPWIEVRFTRGQAVALLKIAKAHLDPNGTDTHLLLRALTKLRVEIYRN
jgi:hypothetical protein